MKKVNKKILIPLICLSLVLITVVSYVLYVVIAYYRIEDNQILSIKSQANNQNVQISKIYTIATQNLGFGAYTSDFTFFMDGGKESWAKSEESVKECINKGINKVKEFNPNFILLQELDFDSTRSYHIDQREIIYNNVIDYDSVFAVNYDSPFLMYPFIKPHGASKSGIMTLSNIKITSSIRRSLPISNSLSKFLDLDRCYSVSKLNVENGKQLVIYNVHLSAYGGSDEIRSAQMNMLFNDMKSEYEKGNYCIAGGDFNHDFTGNSTQLLNNGLVTDYGWAKPFPTDLLPNCIVRCDDYATLIPTCRNCDIPYIDGNFTIIVDGFLVTKNINILSVENINTGFEYSDHNPVILEFLLN